VLAIATLKIPSRRSGVEKHIAAERDDETALCRGEAVSADLIVRQQVGALSRPEFGCRGIRGRFQHHFRVVGRTDQIRPEPPPVLRLGRECASVEPGQNDQFLGEWPDAEGDVELEPSSTDTNSSRICGPGSRGTTPSL
jgi:hypothetical protein